MADGSLGVQAREAVQRCCELAIELRDALAQSVASDAEFRESITPEQPRELAGEFDEFSRSYETAMGLLRGNRLASDLATIYDLVIHLPGQAARASQEEQRRLDTSELTQLITRVQHRVTS